MFELLHYYNAFCLQVTSQMEAASQADLVFVAVFPEHHSTLVELKPALAGKTLIDVSNGIRINLDGPSNAELLADMFPESSVVKGFNTISAWTLQVGPRDGSRQVGFTPPSSVVIRAQEDGSGWFLLLFCRCFWAATAAAPRAQSLSSADKWASSQSTWAPSPPLWRSKTSPSICFPRGVSRSSAPLACSSSSTCTTSSATSSIPSWHRGRIFSTRCPSRWSMSRFPLWPWWCSHWYTCLVCLLPVSSFG